MSAPYRNSDPTADTAIKAADRAKRLSKDEALRLATEAKARGDMLGYTLFMAKAGRAGR